MKYFILILLFIFSTFCALRAEDINIVKLRTEYTATPLGVDVLQPRFSWQMESQKQGCYQNAYQIIVNDEAGVKVWDSGRIQSDISLNIKYAGVALKPCTRYTWKVSVWDQAQKQHLAESWFETGLMNPDPQLSAWDNAKWIGGTDDNLVLYSHFLPVFKMNVSLQLDVVSSSTRAGFIYGANDERLMDKNKNIYLLENKKDSSFILVELDIAPLNSNKPALLNIYRNGYSQNDKKNVPFKSFLISDSIINTKNKYDVHTIYLTSVLGDTKIYIDGDTQSNFLGDVNLNPVGRGGDYIAFPVIADVGFYVPEKQIAYFSNFEIENYRTPSNTIYSDFHTPYKIDGAAKSVMVLTNPSRNSMPMLRTIFTTSSGVIKKARLYVTARGIYEIYLNGKRIGTDYFNPGATQYPKTHLYQTYDVTENILKGQNALGAILGEGWWSGGSTFMGEYWNFFGDRQSILAKLVITYSNGKTDVITTNPNTWKYFNDGPVVYGSFFQGEVYDATKEKLVVNWSTAMYNDSAWDNSSEIILEGNINTDITWGNPPQVDNYSQMNLIGQYGETVKKIIELTAVSVEEVRRGVFVYDMGQNMVGVPKIYLTDIMQGKKIVLRFAEVKYPNIPAYKENMGMIMLENIRAAMAQEIYIAKGGNETINPRFTYYGYRYVEITGIEKALPLDAVKGEVLSSIHELTSKYETSNQRVNKLWENMTWSTFGNFLSIPTDCPQRNERLGWSGDISVFSRTASYLANVPQFFRRHMLAMRDVQRADGRFPDVAPLGVGFGETIWGSAGITVAWESYLQYNDKEMLVEHYQAMKKYIDYLILDINTQSGIFKEKELGNWGSLGDWLSLEDNKNEKVLFWEAYFIYDLDIMSKMAIILNKKDDAESFSKLCTERKAFFNKTYIDETTGKTCFRGKIVDTQTSYVLPLAFDIIDDKNIGAVQRNLANTITRHNKTDQNIDCPPYSLMTGFIGTAWINKALSDNGYSNLAYGLLQQTSYPSWLYPVEQGATTIWERLNSYTHTDGFGGNNNMNSFNHYSFGAVGAWMYNYSLGITRDENSPGFKHFVLRPEPDITGKMTYAKGYYDSMYGRIESNWEVKNNTCSYTFVVPANTTATVYIPASKENDVTENGKSASKASGVKFLGMEKNKALYLVGSGEYKFVAKII
ncbi:MAG: family 78 glycoside hydrolase catalytic domain [Prolixibacteraceae bacterium]|nr:family 78 glycoside hydrolase catalytic domain [Prolixibacteraceae bacterium]